MHEKLIRQLRNTEHCSECPYDEDCNEFDSCLMELLAADAIEDMNKRIARQGKELQEKDEFIDNAEYLFGEDWINKYNLECEEDIASMSSVAASKILQEIWREDNSGKLLYLFCKKLYNLSRLGAYKSSIDDECRFVVLREDEYKKLKDNQCCMRNKNESN